MDVLGNSPAKHTTRANRRRRRSQRPGTQFFSPDTAPVPYLPPPFLLFFPVFFFFLPLVLSATFCPSSAVVLKDAAAFDEVLVRLAFCFVAISVALLIVQGWAQ